MNKPRFQCGLSLPRAGERSLAHRELGPQPSPSFSPGGPPAPVLPLDLRADQAQPDAEGQSARRGSHSPSPGPAVSLVEPCACFSKAPHPPSWAGLFTPPGPSLPLEAQTMPSHGSTGPAWALPAWVWFPALSLIRCWASVFMSVKQGE